MFRGEYPLEVDKEMLIYQGSFLFFLFFFFPSISDADETARGLP